MPGGSDLLVEARSALLDALEALQDHRDAVIVIGAQAVYLHTGAAQLALAEATRDSDLAIDTRSLADRPLLVGRPARRADPGRLVDKDAHDIYRLLVAVPTQTLQGTLIELLAEPLSAQSTRTALELVG